MTRFKIRLTQFGWSLFYDEALVASSCDSVALMVLVLKINMVKGGACA